MATAAFDVYVPRLVREWVADDPDPNRLHRRLDGTAVFADVSGFTKMSERLARRGKVGAETIAGVIETCFTALLEVAHSHGGTLVQFGGDAVLLFYRGAGHEVRAAASALEMRRTMRSLVDLTQQVAGVRLSMTVGVNTGAYDFFLVGRSHRQLVVGGPAASQLVVLEAAAQRGEILASPSTTAALPRRNLGSPHELGRKLVGRMDVAPEPVQFLHVPLDMSDFVAAGLRDTIEGGPIDSEHRTATLAFVEYRGLDTVIARDGPAAAAGRLERLMVGVQGAIDHRGICFQSADLAVDGGKFYVSAGAPRSSGHDEEQMLLALTTIVELDVGLPLRAGANSGAVFMGEIRSTHRSTFITMGDPVNLAARVMSKATPDSVFCTRSVLDRSRTLFEHVAVPPFMVKGKAKPVEAFAVGAARGERTEIAATNLPLVGRCDEVRQFRAALRSVESGTGSLVQVIADAGAGKSRLLDELATIAAPRACHRVRCRLYQASTPYFPFSELLPTLLGAPAGLTADVLRERVEDRAPELLPWLALIGAACGLTIEPSPEVEALEPEFRRARLAAAVVALLSSTLVEPTVLCVDDAQWMDEASCDLFDVLARDVASRPWLVVLGQRPDPGGPTSRIRSPDLLIELRALATEALAELVACVTADDPLPRRHVDALIGRCGGNPLFLLELLNAVRAGEDVESLPRSVEGLLTARIDRLTVAERTLLRHLSVLGTGFDASYVADVAPRRDERWSEGVGRLGEFLRSDDGGWLWFRHHLVRDVAYEGLPYSRRRELHERVAESIVERVGDDDLGDVATLLSLHFSRAGRPQEAWRFSRVAGDRAKGIFANVDAISLYQRALQAAKQIDLEPGHRAATLAALGDVEDLAGLFGDARRSYTAARRLLAGDPIAESEMLLKTAFIDERLGRFVAAVRTIRRGLRALDGCSGADADQRRAELLGWYAAIRLRQGRFPEAAEASAEAMRLAASRGETATSARAMMTLDYARNSLGDEVNVAGTRRALEIYTGLGDIAGEAAAANVLGGYAYFAGQWDQAVELYRRSRAARERTGDPVGVATANANLAEILVEQGALEEAELLLASASVVWRAADDAWGVAFAGRLRGTGRARAGDDEGAGSLLRQARADFAALGATPDVVETDVALAELHLLCGEAPEALRLLDRIVAAGPARTGLEHLVPAIHRLRGLARAVLSTGSADDDLDIAEHTARERGADHELALAVRARRLTWSWRGEEIDAALAAEAAAIERRLGLRPRREPVPLNIVDGT